MARKVWDDIELYTLNRMGTMALIRTITTEIKLVLAITIALKVFHFT
jgi:hypothetical protein